MIFILRHRGYPTEGPCTGIEKVRGIYLGHSEEIPLVAMVLRG